jgi:phosphonate transport system substrate-binding protein
MTCSVTIAEHNQQLDKTKIILGVHPYLPAPELAKRFSPLTAYLEAHLKVKVALQISQNYETHIEHIANNVLDIAFMGPSSYVTLTTNHGKHPLLARLEVNGKPHLYGNIIVHKSSNITDIKQLTGKRFAFGSPRSTMSYIVPHQMLDDSGVTLDSLSKYKFLGNHRNVALGVLLGDFDAGAVKEEVFHEFKDKGLISIARTPAISEHLFVTRNDFPAARIKAIRSMMLELSETKQGVEILQGIKSTITGLVPVKHSDYNALTSLMSNK